MLGFTHKAANEFQFCNWEYKAILHLRMLIIIIITPIIVLIWLLLKNNKQGTIAKNEIPNDSYTLKESILEKDICTTEQPFFYYKVCEVHNGNYNEDKQYKEAYFFKNGDLITRKFDAEEWYNRRKVAVENKQQLLKNSNIETIQFGVKLFLVENCNDEVVNTYLLRNEHGIDNEENRLIEAITLDNSGYDKRSPVRSIIHQNNYGTVNSFLNGETPRTFNKT